MSQEREGYARGLFVGVEIVAKMLGNSFGPKPQKAVSLGGRKWIEGLELFPCKQSREPVLAFRVIIKISIAQFCFIIFNDILARRWSIGQRI